MDKIRLILEVRKRPQLWESEKKISNPRLLLNMWEEVAAGMESNVTAMECKLKWQMLRSDYTSALIRTERRIQRDKRRGTFDPKNAYDCKGFWFKHMSFLRQIINHRLCINKGDEHSQHFSETNTKDNNEMKSEENSLNGVDSINAMDIYDEKNRKESDKHQHAQTKDSAQQSRLIKINFSSQRTSQYQTHTNNNPALRIAPCSQNYYLVDLEKEQKFNKSTILARKNCNDLVYADDYDYNFLVSCVAHMNTMNKLQNLQFRAKITDLILNMLSISKYSKLSHEPKEQNLMKSMVLDIARSNNSVYAGDSNYHFLVSCLPQMQIMSQLQNIEFRAKAIDLLLNILSPYIISQSINKSFEN